MGRCIWDGIVSQLPVIPLAVRVAVGPQLAVGVRLPRVRCQGLRRVVGCTAVLPLAATSAKASLSRAAFAAAAPAATALAARAARRVRRAAAGADMRGGFGNILK